VRGASALGRLLDEERAPLAAFVVWEPVIESDRGPPAPSVFAPVADRRAARYWDPQRRVSAALVEASRADAGHWGLDGMLTPEGVAWDVVAVWPPGARFTDRPRFLGGPVEDSIDGARRALH